MNADLLVIAKEPVPGRSKTRLTPPLSETEAASVAEAALVDTLSVAAATPARRRILVLDGAPGDWLPEGFEVIAQTSGGLDARLAGAFAATAGPALLIGMDTPQVSSTLLAGAMGTLCDDENDAVLGPAEDGGWWAIGLQRPVREAFWGIPMSTRDTCRAQIARLNALKLAWAELPTLRDVDEIADARAVAAQAPSSRFATRLSQIEAAWPVVA